MQNSLINDVETVVGCMQQKSHLGYRSAVSTVRLILFYGTFIHGSMSDLSPVVNSENIVTLLSQRCLGQPVKTVLYPHKTYRRRNTQMRGLLDTKRGGTEIEVKKQRFSPADRILFKIFCWMLPKILALVQFLFVILTKPEENHAHS